ncbi:NVEALA domain-containing protein, partial [Bacteroides sp.]
MKKRVYVALSIAIVIMSAGYNIYQNQKAETTLSDLTLANVEALADTGEG